MNKMRELSEQEIVRRNKVEEISKVCNPYPERYEITHRLHEAVNLRYVIHILKDMKLPIVYMKPLI